MPLLRIEEWPIERLKPNPRNYRSHPEEKIRHVMRLLQEFGFYGPIVVAPDGTILARHSVYEAARRLGYEQVPVCIVDRGNPDKLLVADNEVTRIVEEDEEALFRLLAELHRQGELEGTGWSEEEFAALEQELADILDMDALPAPESSNGADTDCEQLQAADAGELSEEAAAPGFVVAGKVSFDFGPYRARVDYELYQRFEDAWQQYSLMHQGAQLAEFIAAWIERLPDGSSE